MSKLIATFKAQENEKDTVQKLDWIFTSVNKMEENKLSQVQGHTLADFVHYVTGLIISEPLTTCRYFLEASRQYPAGSDLYSIMYHVLKKRSEQNVEILYTFAELCRIGYFHDTGAELKFERAAKAGHEKSIARLRQQRMAAAARNDYYCLRDMSGVCKLRERNAASIYEELIYKENRYDFMFDLVQCYYTLHMYKELLSLMEYAIKLFPDFKDFLKIKRECKWRLFLNKVFVVIRIVTAIALFSHIIMHAASLPIYVCLSLLWLGTLAWYVVTYHPIKLIIWIFSIITAPFHVNLDSDAVRDMTDILLISSLL